MKRPLFVLLTSTLLFSHAFAKTESACTCSPEQFSKAFTNVAKTASPAVVFIKVQGAPEERDLFGSQGGAPQSPFDQFGDDFFNRFFGGQQPSGRGKPTPQLSQGSGFLVSADGYILTNAHVIKGAEKITVVFHDGKELDATVVGTDAHTDVAVVKVEGKNFPFLRLGDSEKMEPGEWVIAIGSPFQLEATVTVGVISAKGRQNLRINDLEDFIQTDAAINPGNSGGPLINLNCEVIGINTAIVSRSGGYMGIGFAIPSNMARNIMSQIIDKGTVTRGFLGISLQPVDKDIAEAFNLERPEGALVSEVIKDSPADKAGVKQGDIILEYNKIPVKTMGGFRNEISLMEPGSVVNLKINRKGQLLTIAVTLGTASDRQLASGGIVGKIGMEVDNLSPEVAAQLGYPSTEQGVVITKIKPGSPAATAGLRPGFIVLAINHKKVMNVGEFNDVMNEATKSKRALFLIRQGNVVRFYPVKVE